MKHRIRRIAVLKAATIGGIAYAAMSLLFVPLMLFFVVASRSMAPEAAYGGGDWLMGPAFLLLAPLIYGVIGFVATALAAAIYNLIAMMVGGLEIELEPAP